MQPSNANTSENSHWNLLFGAWFLALASALGSLFFSEIMNFAPCSLCWYQRLALFPLVIILFRGLFPFDKGVLKYSIPFALIGVVLAIYHNLLYVGIIPENLTPCSQGISCKEEYIELLGFITIPFMSLISFSSILTLLIILKKRISKWKNKRLPLLRPF